MRKRYKSGIVASALTTAALLVGFQTVVTAHPNVPLRDAAGNPVADSTTPYSPKTTCGACHNKSVADTLVPGAYGHGPVGSYDGGGQTKDVVKTQGVLNQATGAVEWVTYTVTDYEHGFVTGRHSQQGRNEEYGNHLRHALGSKFWESSPGMFGKY